MDLIKGLIKLSIDELQQVLYVKHLGLPCASSEEAPDDGNLIFNFNQDKTRMVGLQIISAYELSFEDWKNHPNRYLIREELLEVVDEWYASIDKKKPLFGNKHLDERVKELEQRVFALENLLLSKD